MTCLDGGLEYQTSDCDCFFMPWLQTWVLPPANLPWGPRTQELLPKSKLLQQADFCLHPIEACTQRSDCKPSASKRSGNVSALAKGLQMFKAPARVCHVRSFPVEDYERWEPKLLSALISLLGEEYRSPSLVTVLNSPLYLSVSMRSNCL